MTKETETIRDAYRSTVHELAELTAQMCAPALDGETHLLIRFDVTGGTRIYGDWPEGKGWAHAEAVPSHLCGAFVFAPQRARTLAAKLGAGHAAFPVRTWRAERWEALERRAAEFKRLLGDVEFSASREAVGVPA